MVFIYFTSFDRLYCSAVEFLVLPEDKSKGRRDDVIRRAADELRVAVEGVCQRLFKLEFADDGLGWFLNKGHCGSPFELSLV